MGATVQAHTDEKQKTGVATPVRNMDSLLRLSKRKGATKPGDPGIQVYIRMGVWYPRGVADDNADAKGALPGGRLEPCIPRPDVFPTG